MAIDFNDPPSPTSDFPAEESQTNQESQPLEAAENGTRNDLFYKTKQIQFRGRTKNIILQNKNGPCPLIAICNVLILRNDIFLHPDIFEVSQENLLRLVAERLIEYSCNVDSNDEEYIEIQQKKLSDALERLPCLADGINVDIKFMRIDDFEFTRELAIFDVLKIPLYHGWIIDPQDLETVTAIGCKSYNALTTELVVLKTHTAKAQSGQTSGECSVDFAASITAALGVPSQGFSKTRSFTDSPPASAENTRFVKVDMEEEIALLRAIRLSERETGFDTHRDSSRESLSEDDTLVTSVDASAGCTSTLGSTICQQSKSDDLFSSTESEYETGCNVGKKITVAEEVCSPTSITESSEAHDHDQLSSTKLGDETVCDVETENSSKVTDVHVTSSEAPISVKKSNLDSAKNDIIYETPLKSEAVTFVNPVPDLSGKSQDNDVPLSDSEECVSICSPFYEGESLLGQSSSEGKDTKGLTPKEGEVIKRFLNDNASQLTWPGLFYLQEGLKEGELCVLFRNNHFYTMLKRHDELYTLVTDQGYLMEQDLVWEILNQINGDSVFIPGNFKVFESGKSQKWDQQDAISKTANFIFGINSEEDMDINPDLKLAMDLQQEDLAGDSDSKVPITRSNHMSSSIQEVKAVLRCQNVQACSICNSYPLTTCVYFTISFVLFLFKISIFIGFTKELYQQSRVFFMVAWLQRSTGYNIYLYLLGRVCYFVSLL